MQHLYRHIQRNPLFHELERKRSVFCWVMVAIALADAYFYILVTAFNPGLFGRAIGDGNTITWGIVAGLAQIALNIGFVGLYVWRANSEFDRLNRAVVDDALAHAGPAAEQP